MITAQVKRYSLVTTLFVLGVYQSSNAMDYTPHSGWVRPGSPVQCSGYSCIPSSNRCDGSCCNVPFKRVPLKSNAKSAPEVFEQSQVPKEIQEQKKAVDQLRDALKLIIKNAGKTEAVKILKDVFEESDSDTESSCSANSPHSRDEADLNELLSKRK